MMNFVRSSSDPGSQDGLGRTYRWLNLEKQAPLYPFGFGASYSQWAYSDLKLSALTSQCGTVTATATVTNSGGVDGSEVSQLYLANEAPSYGAAARWRLAGFERLDLKAGKSATVSFELPPLARAEVRASDAARWLAPSTFSVYVGGGQPKQLPQHATSNVLHATLLSHGAAQSLASCKPKVSNTDDGAPTPGASVIRDS